MHEFYANKSVVVVGATGIFGRLTSLSLVEHGADVRLLVRRPSELDERLRVLPHAVADLTKRSDVVAAMAALTVGDARKLNTFAGRKVNTVVESSPALCRR